MTDPTPLVVGELVRKLDDRFRVTIPQELLEPACLGEKAECVLVKERLGALSLWERDAWQKRIGSGVDLVTSRVQAGRLTDRPEQVQRFARLLSTRHRDVQLAARGRLLVPEGFREFLAVKPAQDCVLVGAGYCVELWHPVVWRRYLKQNLPEFGELFEDLAQ